MFFIFFNVLLQFIKVNIAFLLDLLVFQAQLSLVTTLFSERVIEDGFLAAQLVIAFDFLV